MGHMAVAFSTFYYMLNEKKRIIYFQLFLPLLQHNTPKKQVVDVVHVNDVQKVLHEYSASYKWDEWEAALPFWVSAPSYSCKSYVFFPHIPMFQNI